jgi:hypothetical protein
MDMYNKEVDPTNAMCKAECDTKAECKAMETEVDPTNASAINESGIIVPTKVMDPYDGGNPNYSPIPIAKNVQDGTLAAEMECECEPEEEKETEEK